MRHLLFILVGCVGVCVNQESTLAQDADSAKKQGDGDASDRAERIMRKLDSNADGRFDESENKTVWNRYRQLDKNGDGSLTVEELTKEQREYLDAGGERKLDVVYKRVSQRELLLDLYYPKSDPGEPDSRLPVVFYTHGGGWAAGSKHGITKGSFAAVFRQLLEHGFTVASVNYRLCRPGTGVTMRDCVIDCKDAMRYLAKHSAELRLDSSRFFVMGDSAGGQIAQMLLLSSLESLDGDQELSTVPYKVLAGVSWYGPSDFENMDLFNHDDSPGFRDRFGPRILGETPDPTNKLRRYREMSPVNYLSQDSMPLLMIQGDKDTTIPVKHAHFMKQKAIALKAPVQVMIIKNAGHNWRRVGDEIEPSRDAIVERTVKFFVER